MARLTLARQIRLSEVTASVGHHIAICGHPRSGSTLLHQLLVACLPSYGHFDREVPFARASAVSHDRLISKRPLDVHQPQDFLEAGPRRLSVLITVRDPRAMLVSRHARVPDDYFYHADFLYFAPPERSAEPSLPGLIDVHEACMRLSAMLVERGSRPFLVRYEALLEQPDVVQAALGRYLDVTFSRSFSAVDLEEETAAGMSDALNGARPLDLSRLAPWRAPEHRTRVSEQFQRFPELFEVMEELGYEWSDEDLSLFGLEPAAAL